MSLGHRLGVRGVLCGLLLGSAVGLSPVREARASLVVALDLPSMVERADHVAVVDVNSVSSAWDDKHERIFTTIDLSVVETWKGPMATASHLKVVQPGGVVGDIQMTVFGMSQFTPGERALVFLRGTPTAASVVGMAQGKRLVRRDASTGRWMVHAPDRAGASFVRVPARGGATPAPSASGPSKSGTPPVFETRLRGLDELRAEVRGLMVATPSNTGRAPGK
ncbi:MAG TPA: hypothetical protein VHK47_13760 [Polyangia bacterium]|nr:hypothetical protein [Polyangia bacterium]